MNNIQDQQGDAKQAPEKAEEFSPPPVALPKGGGAIRGIGEKFTVNPVTGTGSMTVPINTSPGRSNFGPQLVLSYDSGRGNGLFGLGWSLSLPAITRKTDKGLPKYQDGNEAESDIFIFSEAEDLVPALRQDAGGAWRHEILPPRIVNGTAYRIRRYLPRIESLFARIERWTNQEDPKDVFWRTISKDNITTWYGKSANSRIADPVNPAHIFSWLVSERYDDKGKIISYIYKEENSEGIDISHTNERNRAEKTRSAGRHIKFIRYGNHEPYFPEITENKPWPTLPDKDQWYFEVVFDYGEHDPETPKPDQEVTKWKIRSDPFSSYRAGFEVRTYRLCRRVLMFHHFENEPQIGRDCLVRSNDFTYPAPGELNDSNPIYSILLSVSQSGYQRQGAAYLKDSLPPVEFEYTQPQVNETIREVDPESLQNLPVGIDGRNYQWVDLDGEGLSGILSEQSDGWFYKRNLSPLNLVKQDGTERTEARFGAVELIAEKPSNAALLAGGQRFLDLSGDGQLDLVELGGPMPGFFERTVDENWKPFSPFTSLPALDWNDPNLRFLDLTGDGLADILISEENVFRWHPSLGESGFGDEQRSLKVLDEEKGPAIVFADRFESIFLADLSGDGLTDIARIRNGEVCYWPNLGYGRFGPKVTMDHAPWFEAPDLFDGRRLRLVDVDGSGTNDILYLGSDGLQLYYNQSGNGWSMKHTIPFPRIDNLSSVMAMDMLGNGTACLVWSSPSAASEPAAMRYIDLMGGQKPHLLVRTTNNLGAETKVQYAPSTRSYLEDKLAGKPWVTRVPFPVQVVEKVTTRDKWRKTEFTSTYSYHHGYFDGTEREFRGFGRVEQIDVEDYGVFAAANPNSPFITNDKTLYQPPVKIVTWYHTGALLERERILSHFENEYFPKWFEDLKPGQQVLGDFRENPLPEPDLDALDLTPDEWREALRACKGMMLRQEIYELDVDALANGKQVPVRLFTSAYHNCHIHRVQPKAVNQHAVFLATESEAILYNYELDLRDAVLTPDPRINHAIKFSIDEFGNVQQAVTIVYPRLSTFTDATLQDGAETLIRHLQQKQVITYNEIRYTTDVNDPADPDRYRLRIPCETLTYEVTGIKPDGLCFTLKEFRNHRLSEKYQSGGVSVPHLDYHLLPDNISPQKRIIEHTRSVFFDNSLTKPLEFGKLNALALPFENYRLALTDDVLNLVFKDKITAAVSSALADKKTSGYLSGPELVARFGNAAQTGQYWIRSGIPGFQAGAAQRFYMPDLYSDPFGNTTTLIYDPKRLFVQSSIDPGNNRTEVIDYDFRVLAARLLKDPNHNLSETRFDILGMPAAMALMGKGNEGDQLNDFTEALLNPDLTAKQNFFINNDYDVAVARNLLRGASSRNLYYFGQVIENNKIVWGKHPPCTCGIVREQHFNVNPNSPLQTVFQFSDGAGITLAKKLQAEPEQSGGPLRWVVSGKVILNNKRKPVKQYEPYFSAQSVGHRFEEPEEAGVSPIIYYDSLSRVIRIELPNGSYTRVEFSPWHIVSFDTNDTVKEDNNQWFARNSALTALPENQRAARLAAEHANTPWVTFLDSSGREVCTVAHNRVGPANAMVNQKYFTFTKLDSETKPLWVQDARGNRVMQYIVPPFPDGPRKFDDPSNLNPQNFIPGYDIAGNLLFQHSAEAGDKWMLNNAVGKSMFAWKNPNFVTRTTYDELQRLTGSLITGADPVNAEHEIQFEKIVYGEGQAGDVGRNLRGKMFQRFDTAGIISIESYDFKGNALKIARQLMADYKAIPDWSQNPALDPEHFACLTRFDALSRAIQSIAPHSTSANPQHINITQPVYNEAGLMQRIDVWLNHATEPTTVLAPNTADEHVMTNINYDAKGQRVLLKYGNGSQTRYDYEPDTFRLKRLKTVRNDNAVLQDLNYTYDPVGNIVQIFDAAQDSVFHSNHQVLPGADYRYDALYRLVGATGREHKGNALQYDWNDEAHFVTTLPNDAQALQNYTELFRYDAVGNILQMAHHAGRILESPGVMIWNRRYQYAIDSNRLLGTSVPADTDGLPDYVASAGYTDKYSYDPRGNMIKMPHLPQLQWDFMDRLSATSKQVVNNGTPETTYYVYDATGRRVRKVTESQPGISASQRIYWMAAEIYREYSGAAVALERDSLHVADEIQPIALIETQTIENQLPVANLQPHIRYQMRNHLGSVQLELDENSAVITYEEYTPYGSTAYRAGINSTEVNRKRYRYTGKERDDENGFTYHGARYYAPWLGRWTAGDPIGIEDGLNLYAYARNKPIVNLDMDGKANTPIHEQLTKIVAMQYVDMETAEAFGKAANLPDTETKYESIYESLKGDPSRINEQIHVLGLRTREEKIKSTLANYNAHYKDENIDAKDKSEKIKDAGVYLFHPLQDANYHLPGLTFGVGMGHFLFPEADLAVGDKTFEQFYQVVQDTRMGMEEMKEKGIIGPKDKPVIKRLTKAEWMGIYNDLKSIESGYAPFFTVMNIVGFAGGILGPFVGYTAGTFGGIVGAIGGFFYALFTGQNIGKGMLRGFEIGFNIASVLGDVVGAAAGLLMPIFKNMLRNCAAEKESALLEKRIGEMARDKDLKAAA